MALVDLEFTRSLPKVELHAHLTGSITARTLHEIWQYRSTDTSSTSLLLATDVEDPLLVLSSDRNWDVRTFFPLFSSYIYRLVSDSASIVYSLLTGAIPTTKPWKQWIWLSNIKTKVPLV